VILPELKKIGSWHEVGLVPQILHDRWEAQGTSRGQKCLFMEFILLCEGIHVE
jgi:hypothetical protein